MTNKEMKKNKPEPLTTGIVHALRDTHHTQTVGGNAKKDTTK